MNDKIVNFYRVKFADRILKNMKVRFAVHWDRGAFLALKSGYFGVKRKNTRECVKKCIEMRGIL